MKKLSLRGRILAILAIAIGGLAAIGILNTLNSRSLIRATRHLGEFSLNGVATVGSLVSAAESQKLLVSRAPEQFDEKEIKEDLQRFEEYAATSNTELAKLEAFAASDPQLSEGLVALREKLPLAQAEARKVYALASQFRQIEAAEHYQRKVAPLLTEITDRLVNLQSRSLALAAQQPGKIIEAARAGERTLNFIGWAVIGITVLLGWWQARLITRRISSTAALANAIARGELPPLVKTPGSDEIGDVNRAFNRMIETSREIIRQASTIAQGNYDVALTPRSDKDELVQTLEKMARALKTLSENTKQQDWLKTGMNHLGERLRGEQDLPTLARNVLGFLANYLHAHIGVLYATDDGKTLRLVGSHALVLTKTGRANFDLGEGLVGQAALSREAILVEHVPPNYILVESGVGQTGATSLLLLPLVRDNELLGVLELASLQPFSSLQRDFLNLAAESIAIALHSAAARARVAQLLRRTQEQAQELRNQQEELRQTSEELTQQQEALLEAVHKPTQPPS